MYFVNMPEVGWNQSHAGSSGDAGPAVAHSIGEIFPDNPSQVSL